MLKLLKPLLFLKMSVLLLGFLSSSLSAFIYTNATTGGRVLYAAISNITNKIYLGSSPVYTGAGKTANNAGTGLDNDYPIYYTDFGSKLTARHRALGFIDVMISVDINPYTSVWRMYGDGDRRDDSDYRAVDGNSTVWELGDTNYRSYHRGLATTISNMWLTTTNYNYGSQLYLAKSGEFCVARMLVPRYVTPVYGLFLGKQMIRLGAFGSEGAGVATRVQVNLHTPMVSNKLIPVIDILSPTTDGVWDAVYDDASAFRFTPVKRMRVPAGVPITLSARNSFNETGSGISSYEWDVFGTGSFVADGDIKTVTYDIGTYNVYLKITAGGITVTNNGDFSDSPNNFKAQLPAFTPSALPFLLEAVSPPVTNTLSFSRPSPFIIGLTTEVQWDYAIAKAATKVVATIHRFDGVVIQTLLNSDLPAGSWTLRWDGTDSNKVFVGEGIYYLRVENGNDSLIRKILVVRLK